MYSLHNRAGSGVPVCFPSFRYTLQDGGVKNDITMHAAGNEWH